MKYKATQKDRYGNMKSLEITMDNQLEVPPMTSAVPAYDHPGEPRGTDTVPAWLTPGEFVVNKEATDMYGPLIKKINDEGRKVQDMKEPMYATEGVEVPVNRPKYLMEDYVFDKLVKKYGYNPKVAAMVVGGLGGETNGLVASSHQMKGGPGRGIAQWEKGGRFDTDNTNLLAHAKNLGTDWDNLDTQIDFINKEFREQGRYKGLEKEMENMSLEDGTYLFINKYLRPNEKHVDSKGNLTFPGRLKRAEQLSNNIYNLNTIDPGLRVPEVPDSFGGSMVKDIPRPDSDGQSLGSAAIGAVQKGMANTYDNIRKNITGMMPNFSDTEETKARFNKRRKEVSKKVNTNKSAEQAFNLDIGGLVPGIDFPSDPRDNEENFLKKMLGYDSRTSSPPPVTDPGFKDYGELIPRLPIDYDPQGTGGMPEMEKVDPTFQNILRQNTPPDVTIGEDDFTAKAMSEVPVPNEFSMMGNLSDLGQQYDSTTRTDMGNDNALTDAFAPKRIPEPAGMTDTDLMKMMEESFTNEQAYDGTAPEGIGMPMADPTYTSSYDKMVQEELTGSPAYEIPAPLNIDPDAYDQETGDKLLEVERPVSMDITKPEVDVLGNLTLEQSPGATENAITSIEGQLETALKDLQAYQLGGGDKEGETLFRDNIRRLEDLLANKKKRQALIDFKKKQDKTMEAYKEDKKEQAKVQSLQEIINSNETTQTEKNNAAEELAAMGVQTEAEKQKEIENEKLSKIASQVDTNLENAMTNDLNSPQGQSATTNASQNEPEVSKARQMFNFLFGDMIDSGEIGRAIAVYLGSRALGYDHGSSIGYVAKQYLKRVDAQNAAWDKWTRDNMTKYTPASMAKFRRTRDVNDLIPLGNPIRSTGKRETYYHPTLGKGQAFEFKVANASGDDTTFWSFDPSGQNQKLVVGSGWTSENILDVSTDEINLIEKMLTGFQNKFDKETTGSKSKGTERTMYYSSMGKVPGVVPAAAAAEVAQWLHERGIPPGKFKEPIAEAYKLLIEHNKERAAAGEDDQIQSSLLPFLQESTVKLRLEDMSYIDDEGKKRLIPSPIKGKVGDSIRTMDTKVLMELEREISTFFPAGTEDRFWAQAAKAWMTDSDVRKEFEEAAKKKVNSDYTPFSLFAKVLIANELEKAANESTQ